MANGATSLNRLTKRPDYLAVAATRRKWVTPSFILQAMQGAADTPPRVGFTVSKKVGNAVARNRARRRLKEATRAIAPLHGSRGWSYVFVGRQAAISYPFDKMCSDIKWALAKLEAGADLRSDGKSRAGTKNG